MYARVLIKPIIQLRAIRNFRPLVPPLPYCDVKRESIILSRRLPSAGEQGAIGKNIFVKKIQ
jgi:hypothetical protein